MSRSDVRPLASLRAGERGRVVEVLRDPNGRSDRLTALGVTPGARVRVLQTFPGIVFECDQTELAVERGVARAILVSTSLEVVHRAIG
jgi:DtxR family transcriptional regulator, Mn-dependent transcriptional regulator